VITLEGTSQPKNTNQNSPNTTGPIDIIEEIIAEEIVDETDRYEDNQSKRRARRMTTAAVMRGGFFFFFFSLLGCDDISVTGSWKGNSGSMRRALTSRANAAAGNVARGPRWNGRKREES